MSRRHLFVAAVFLALIFSALFTSWTSEAVGAGKKTSEPLVSSFPPDTIDYSRPAIPNDVSVSGAAKGFSSPAFLVVDIPNSGGGEPDIAINPLNLSQIVVHAGFGGWGSGNAPNFVSSDGGITWTTSNQIPPPPGDVNAANCPCDITQDYGIDGSLYGAYLDAGTDIFSASNTNPFFNLFSYFLSGGNAVRTNFGGTLNKGDQPWLMTNRDPTTASQTNTYIAYTDLTGFARVSAALGTNPPNFTKDNAAGPATGGAINPGTRLAVDPNRGTIYTLWEDCIGGCGSTPTSIAYELNRSLDAGSNWKLNGSSIGITVATGVTVQPTPKFGTVNALLGGIDHLAVDPTTSNLYVVFGAANGSPSQGIFIRQITFDNSSPTNAILGTVHQVSPSGVQAALPSVAVAPDGTVGVLYTTFDGFDVSNFPIFSGHFAFSTDAGATFTDKTLLTFLSPAKSDDPPANNDTQRVLGDYQQLRVVGATFFGAFTGNGAALGGNTANNDAIFFKVALAPQINLNESTVPIGNVCEGSTAQGQLEVSNTGPDNLIVSSVTHSFGSPDISLVSGPTFPVNISPDANFDFAFACTPTTSGAKTATFTIVSNDPAKPDTTFTVTCNTDPLSLSVPGSLTFPPTVVQSTASCSSKLGVPIVNTGVCPLKVTNIALTANPDYSLTGLATLPLPIPPGGQLGTGDLNAVFAPIAIERTSTANVNVTFEDNAFTHHTTTDTVPLCGEGVNRGLRVLVTLAGVPVSSVKRIELQSAFGPEQPNGNFSTHQVIKNAALQSIFGSPPCASFEFNAEFGGVTNPKQLKDGEYRVKVQIKVGKKTKTKVARVNMDECTFTPNVVVAF